jgi:alanyl-tRNA synthetase
MTDLLVTYPAGSIAESSTVAAVTRVNGRALFAVARTPCHPESPRWPDQPADRCTLEADGAKVPVECREGWLLGGELSVAAPPREPTGEDSTGKDSTGKDSTATGEAASAQGDTGAIPCVVHSVPAELAPVVGEQVALSVDEPYREALSRSHSRCHLVSLALNAALAEAWRRDPPARDSLGNPDFDQLAITASTIDEHDSLDEYRVGRHLRKSGFLAESLSDPEALASAVEDIARRWLQSSPRISVRPGECALRERRTWSCALPEGTASLPCGGTHPDRLAPEPDLRVQIAWDPERRRLAMRARDGYFHV